LDDNHHPVPITKNNFGFPTTNQLFNYLTDFSSQLREDFQFASKIRLSPNCELAGNYANLLVPINAFDLQDYTQVIPNRQEPQNIRQYQK